MDLLNLQPNKINRSVQSKIFLFYGEPKTWKTTVAAGFPKPLILAAEKGYQFIDGVYALPILRWADIKEAVYSLDDNRVKEKYQTIVIDTASNAYGMCETYIKNRENVKDIGQIPYGKGYKMVGDEFASTCTAIASMGYTLVFICHADETQDDKDQIKIKPKLDKRAYAYITGLADFIIYSRKEVDEDGVERCFGYSQLENTTCGGRARYMAPRFLFTYDELVKSVEEAIDKQIAELGYNKDEYNYDTSNVHVEQPKDVEKLKTEIYNLLDCEFDSDTGSKVEEFILSVLHNQKISDATENQYDELFAIKDFLMETRKKLNIV